MDGLWTWKLFCFLTCSSLAWALCPNNSGVIDLSHQGLTSINASVFVDCPADAHTLILSGNNITRIHNDSFLEGQTVKFYQLLSLDLSNNHIEHIDDTAFGLLRRLEVLNLSGNSLTMLQSLLLDNKFYLRAVDFS
ncbi:hypothetical protein FSP39_008254 [Pinctada imbricata]|uniref:Uncharacterized protein n=1 Tax=Pinctada imbricata TaxID=66713 RepID=A0AA89C6V6_PINIB|nr:hypothetical protein FSP39_008254 [Pinctada imbricata]